MSSTTVPEVHPASIEAREDEPLLGRPGGVTQREDDVIYYNLLTGSAIVAQAGIWILLALVWSAIFSRPLSLFSAHPLLNSSALLIQVQAILIVQPTATPKQKNTGAIIHFFLHTLSVIAFLSAFIIIEISKGGHPHFASVHGILGLTTYSYISLQTLVGIAQFFFPVHVFGSVENGKKIYKYHRITGYILLVLEFTTVSFAVQTTAAFLNIKLWSVLVAVVLVLLGVGARIKKRKLGL